MVDSDLIAAIATPDGRAGIGILRVSGRNLRPLCTGILGGLPAPRRAVFRQFVGAGHEVIDEGIAIYFAAPDSYTGEDVLELHGHGNPLVMQLTLQRCLELGARLAEPGEFTKRAFLNGKLDLAQAEAVADLVEASTEQAARSALRSLQGQFSERISGMAAALTELRVLIEAGLDFPEEEPEPATAAEIARRLGLLKEMLGVVLDASRRGALMREGARVVLAGEPNVGKSSLLNRLAGEDLAIVTAIPGTTRDAIRGHADIGGIPFEFVDTAGLRETSDAVEMAGIQRTRSFLKTADVVLQIQDARTVSNVLPLSLPPECRPGSVRIVVVNKIDLTGDSPRRETRESGDWIWVSALTGAGLEALRDGILEAVGWRPGGEGIFMARSRHLEALDRVSDYLDSAIQADKPMEFVAEDLRLAQEALGSITGRVSSDALLGEIFSRFCLGK